MRSNINRTVYLPILFLVIFGFSPVGTSSTTSTVNISHRDETAHNTEPLNCTTELSPDFYGFGVRLGVYFAWLSQYFANILLPSEIASSLDTNSIFLLALLASLFRGTLVHELFQIDGLILMHLSSGFLFSSLSIWGYRTSLYQKEGPTAINYFGRFGTHCRLALATAISLYGAWFWWEGLRNGLNIAEDPQCRIVFTWFFKQWPVTGGIHTFYIIISIGCAVYYGTMCVAAVLVVILKLFQGGWKRKIKLQTGFTAFELSIVYNVLRIFNLFWIVFCASMIEMTLNFNHMLNTLAPYGRIGYPGQLVPLVVGILSLVRVLWLIYREWKDSQPEGNARNAASTYQYIRDILWPPFIVEDMASGELEGANMPSTLGPWHHRYLVAYLPWLSALSFWKMANIPYMLTTYQTVASN